MEMRIIFYMEILSNAYAWHVRIPLTSHVHCPLVAYSKGVEWLATPLRMNDSDMAC